MKKDEFLVELRKKLNGLPKEEIDSRIDFYGEMIDDRIDEGKSEELAVAEMGTIDEVVQDIAKDTPLLKLVKERIKPKRSFKGFEILLLVLGFPLWFPLLLTGLVLLLVVYLLIWVFAIVAFAIEISLIASCVACLISFVGYLFEGNFNILPLGCSLMSAGAAILLAFGCKGITKLTIKFSRSLINKIKTSFIKKGRK